jgi:hypothetical protein
MAGKRWIRRYAHALAPHHVTVLGDDLYSKQPFCALVLRFINSAMVFGLNGLLK